MANTAKRSMLFPVGSNLTPDEKEKVARLDTRIVEKFMAAGGVVRFYEMITINGSRSLRFSGPSSQIVGTVVSEEFVRASDAEAVDLILLDKVE